MIVGPQKKYLIDSPIPNQNEIRYRMIRRFTTVSSILENIINPCAEEAERIVIELLSSSEIKRSVTIPTRRHRGSRHLRVKRISGYHCPGCNYSHIRLDMQYCPSCGKLIEWK